MKKIAISPAHHGLHALVDNGDYGRLKGFRWFVHRHKLRCGRVLMYAVRHTPKPNSRPIFMHRQIMDAPRGIGVDHVDGRGLNNQRANLRLATQSQNHMNRRKSRGGSRFKGVSWHKQISRWQVHIRIDGKGQNLGVYKDEIEAARAYDRAARRLFGAFARTNFPAKRSA